MVAMRRYIVASTVQRVHCALATLGAKILNLSRDYPKVRSVDGTPNTAGWLLIVK